MRIATYNMLQGGKSLVHWSRLVCEHGVDLLFVQESYAPSRHDKPLVEAQRADRSVWNSVSGRQWGSGVFSTSGRLEQVAIPGFEGWCTGAWLVESNWNTSDEPLLVCSIHAPSIKGASYAQLVNLILDELVRLAAQCPVILGGDFNLTVSRRHSTESRELSKVDRDVQLRIREELGLINCWEAAHPAVPLAQTLRWQKDPLVPYHCDGIFVPQQWADRLEGCDVLDDPTWHSLSDHNPVVATFRR